MNWGADVVHFFFANEFSYLNIEQKKRFTERNVTERTRKIKIQAINCRNQNPHFNLSPFLPALCPFFIIFCLFFVSFFARAYTTRVPISDKTDNPNFLCHPLLLLTSENCVFRLNIFFIVWYFSFIWYIFVIILMHFLCQMKQNSKEIFKQGRLMKKVPRNNWNKLHENCCLKHF